MLRSVTASNVSVQLKVTCFNNFNNSFTDKYYYNTVSAITVTVLRYCRNIDKGEWEITCALRSEVFQDN